MLIDFISFAIIPVLILIILLYAFSKRIDAYKAFLSGAHSGLILIKDLCPTLIALFLAVTVLRSSGFLTLICHMFTAITKPLNIPAEIFPLFIVKALSSSAATGLLLDIYTEYGTDSKVGLIASLMLSSTETIFYTVCVFFGVTDVKKTRYTLAGALIATLSGFIASIIIVL